MAITFEEKNNIGKNAVILFALFLAAGGGFLFWKFSQQSPAAVSSVPITAPVIDKKVLEDPALSSLEVFPDIPPAAVEEAPRKNPFVEQPAAANANAPAVETLP